MPDAPRITHYVVADDSRQCFLELKDDGRARWGDRERATVFPDLEIARKARDAYPSGYIAIPLAAEVCDG